MRTNRILVGEVVLEIPSACYSMATNRNRCPHIVDLLSRSQSEDSAVQIKIEEEAKKFIPEACSSCPGDQGVFESGGQWILSHVCGLTGEIVNLRESIRSGDGR